jgi:hypothetical protein
MPAFSRAFLTAIAGAPSLAKVAAANTANSTLVKTGAVSLTGISLTNKSSGIIYFKFYNKATAPTVGTDVPVLVIGLPATSTTMHHWPEGIPFSLGLGYGIVTDVTDAGTTAVAANDVVGGVFYL